jgi:hypothetical protein
MRFCRLEHYKNQAANCLGLKSFEINERKSKQKAQKNVFSKFGRQRDDCYLSKHLFSPLSLKV